MSFQNPNDEVRREILAKAKRIAVVGLSDNPERESHMVSKAMQQAGYKIIPVNPTVDVVLGEKAVGSLLDIEEPVDIVNVFRRSEFVLPIAEQTVQIGCPVLWLQQGVINEEAADYAEKNGITVIMDKCIKVDHALLRV